MKNLLLASNIAITILIYSCSNANMMNSTIIKGDSIKTAMSNQERSVAQDTAKAVKSEMQATPPNKQNIKRVSNSDSTRHVHFHGSPNQLQVDSTKDAKTKMKFSNKK